MSFLDEATIKTTPEKLAKVKAAASDDDTIEVMEKKGKDMDGDGDIDSDDYLAARDAAIKKAKMKEDLEEGKASKFLGALGIAAGLLAVGQMNKSDSVLKAIDAKIEQADTPAEKAALKKLANQRLVFLDTGKGPGGDIKVSDINDKLNEAKTVELPADTTFTLDLKHLMKKHLDEGKSKEDTIKFTKALMAKLHNKGEVTVDGTKIVFKEGKKKSGYMGYTDMANEASIMGIPLESFADYYTALDLAKNIGVPVVAFSALLAIMGVKKATEFLKRGKEAVMAWYEQNKLNEQEDTQLALPEPPSRDYLGDDGKDYEGGMAKSQILKMKKYAMALCDMVDDETQLEAWVQAKITKASDYMSAVYHYLDYQNSKMNNE